MVDTNWAEVADVNEIDDDEAIQVDINGKPIAVYFTEGNYYATDDLCTHEEAKLSEGYIDGTTIECPLHQGVFCLKTGRALQAPAEADVSIYAVKVVGSKILVQKN